MKEWRRRAWAGVLGGSRLKSPGDGRVGWGAAVGVQEESGAGKKLEAGSRKRRMGIAEVRDWRRWSLRRVEGAREGDEREKGKFRRERREIAACR